jgi:hypothetical protein
MTTNTTACHRWAWAARDCAERRVDDAREAFYVADGNGYSPEERREAFDRWGREIDGYGTILELSRNQYPKACVWWSPTKAAWGCQIGNDRSWHYSEQAAIDCGREMGLAIVQRSMFQVAA